MSRFGGLNTRYFDDNGDPLADGKVYFYESGSLLTAKTTYADVQQTIPNDNPVVLSAGGVLPNVFFSGTANAVLTDANDVVIESRDPVGATDLDGAFAEWVPQKVYTRRDVVTGSDGRYYLSLANGNIGNNPTSGGAEWSRVQFIENWNAAANYSEDSIVLSGGQLYASITDDNQGNDPATDAVNWLPLATGFELGDIAFSVDGSRYLPPDWLPADGSSFDTGTYPDLATLLGGSTLPTVDTTDPLVLPFIKT